MGALPAGSVPLSGLTTSPTLAPGTPEGTIVATIGPTPVTANEWQQGRIMLKSSSVFWVSQAQGLIERAADSYLEDRMLAAEAADHAYTVINRRSMSKSADSDRGESRPYGTQRRTGPIWADAGRPAGGVGANSNDITISKTWCWRMCLRASVRPTRDLAVSEAPGTGGASVYPDRSPGGPAHG